MAVSRVAQREIVEVPYQLPDGSIKPHMALVLSTSKLLEAEEGMFYAVLISSKNINPEFTLEIQDEWLSKPLSKIIVYYLILIINKFLFLFDLYLILLFNNFVKKDYFDAIMNKVILSMFDIEIM